MAREKSRLGLPSKCGLNFAHQASVDTVQNERLMRSAANDRGLNIRIGHFAAEKDVVGAFKIAGSIES
jgi:hypothetical protein